MSGPSRSRIAMATVALVGTLGGGAVPGSTAHARPLVDDGVASGSVRWDAPVLREQVRQRRPSSGPWSAPDVPAGSRARYAWPVVGQVVDGFRAPSNPYGPGHRGVDLAVAPGTPVRAMGPGTIGFAGVVAGRAWVSVDHVGGVRTTVGPLSTIVVRVGDRVGRQVLGTAAATAHADARRTVTGRLHVSARVDGAYVDPTLLVGDRLVATLLDPGS